MAGRDLGHDVLKPENIARFYPTLDSDFSKDPGPQNSLYATAQSSHKQSMAMDGSLTTMNKFPHTPFQTVLYPFVHAAPGSSTSPFNNLASMSLRFLACKDDLCFLFWKGDSCVHKVSCR